MNKYEIIALSQIKNNRLENELRFERLMDELRKDKAFAEAESERDTIRFKIAKLRFQNADLGSLYDDLALAEKRLFSRLSELGYTEGALTPAYNCMECKDTGYANGNLCRCVRSLAYTLIKGNCSTLVTELDDFGAIDYSFIPEADRARYRATANILAKFAEKFPDIKSSILLISGEQGTGKTYLMSVLANALMKKCAGVLFYNAVQINEIFLKYHLAPIEEKDDIFSPLVEADFLVIDDLGAENFRNNVTETYLYELLVLRDSRLTGVTTNLSSPQILSRYGSRISSRLFSKNDSYGINLEGQDLRFIKR
ncbi:MAG TPA: ATP-binding protein [Clostridia bacterium]|jgi:DNA replication protein DnaC|nr:ATP-binding protein [Clostridia bacterium]HOL61368.1 ATP-binding protein [Clostridia bacterium]